LSHRHINRPDFGVESGKRTAVPQLLGGVLIEQLSNEDVVPGELRFPS